MLWSDVEKRYGKRMANKMKKSKMLRGITISELGITCEDCGAVVKAPLKNYKKCKKCGSKNIKVEDDIPERDINVAYKDVTGKYISPMEWD